MAASLWDKWPPPLWINGCPPLAMDGLPPLAINGAPPIGDKWPPPWGLAINGRAPPWAQGLRESPEAEHKLAEVVLGPKNDRGVVFNVFSPPPLEINGRPFLAMTESLCAHAPCWWSRCAPTLVESMRAHAGGVAVRPRWWSR